MAMRIYAIAVYLFLYVPIGIIALFSFNAGRHASQFRASRCNGTAGAVQSLRDGRAHHQPHRRARLRHLASVFGTMAALALQSMRGKLRTLFDAMIYIAVMIPGIVIGIATLIALVTAFNWINPLMAALWPDGFEPPQLSMGYGSLIAAHTLFTMALVIIIVRARISGMDRSLSEASADLYATPFGTFRQVTLPMIFPAILAGFLLSFTFSFDDFIIAFFVAGSETTLPIYVFSSIRRGVTPEINAIGTMVLAVVSLIPC
jgi:spermidine/putrescine transport system permease protein